MIIVSLTLMISIDIEIGDFDHGKDVLDCLNVRDKGYLREKIGYKKFLPQLLKALILFIIYLINKLSVLHNSARKF